MSHFKIIWLYNFVWTWFFSSRVVSQLLNSQNICVGVTSLPRGFYLLFVSQFQGIYVTEIHPESPASKSGLRVHDKILQCNGYDFTMVGWYYVFWPNWTLIQMTIIRKTLDWKGDVGKKSQNIAKQTWLNLNCSAFSHPLSLPCQGHKS